jgi:hypothetical protein
MVAPDNELNGAWSLHVVGVFQMLIKSPNVNINPSLYALTITQMVRTHFEATIQSVTDGR